MNVRAAIIANHFCWKVFARGSAANETLRHFAPSLSGTSFVTLAAVLQRFNAWFLIVLVALPFTAPFSTCDLSLLLSSASPGGLRLAISRDGRSESIEETAPVSATTSILEEEQFKDTLLPATAVVAAANAVTGLPLRVVTRTSGMRQTLTALRL